MSTYPRGEDFSDSPAPQDQLASLLGKNLSMPDPEAVLSEAPPLNAPQYISPQTPALDITPPEAPLVESPVVPYPSVDNVISQSILYRPMHSQITIFREEEEGEVSGSFTLEGEQFGTVHFMDSRIASFRIPARSLIR